MKTKTILLIIIIVSNSANLVAQPAPQIIPAGKPNIIRVPTKNYTITLTNPGTNGKTRQMTPPVTTPILSAEDGGGLSFFANYNTEQGLALSSVACGFRDKPGNLWFGTFGGGVSRYDGKSFTNFTAAQGLANNIVYSITEDKKGNLWFGTGGGVSWYDGKSFTNITTAHGLANNTVWSITQDKTGNLWFGTLGGGVSRYDGKSFTNFTTTDGLGNNTVKSIKEDKSGNLWFATDGGGVSRYDGKSFTSITTAQGLANNNVYSITEDKTGNLWFGTFGGGVSRYDGKSFTNFTTAQGLANNIVLSITEDKKGNLWFATDGGGVSRYDGKSFTNYTTVQGLANNTVWSITQDKTGNLWFGTFGGGVSRYVGKSLTNFTMVQGLANNIVYSIAEDKTGNLWFGTLGGGVSRYDGKSFTNFTTAQGLPNDIIRCITEDKKGNLWFATDGGGVSRYDGKSFTNFTTEQGLANNIVFNITEDKNGNLWFGTDGGGVSRYDGKSFTNFTTEQGLANNNAWSILEDKKGNLWFATYGGGVSRYNGKSFTNFTTEEGLANNNVWNISEDKAGNLWFGTSGGGVSRYDGKSFINFTTAKGLADDEVHDIVIDSQENIFIGTNLGFSVLKGFKSLASGPSPKKVEAKGLDSPRETGFRSVSTGEIIPAVNFLANEEIKNYQPVFEFYNQKTGYPIKDLLINAMYSDSKGIIWGGCGDNKLVRFDYNAVLKNTEPPAVFIQAVKIQEENISWYNLMNNRKKQKINSAFDSLATINEETLIFGSILSDAERDSMRNKFSDIKFDSITPFYPLPVNLVLPYNHNSITFDFVAIEPARNFLVRYQYMLEGYDKDWSPVTHKTSATFGNIFQGIYTFKLKASSPDGVWSEPITYTFKVLPPLWRTWWAYCLYGLLLIAAVWATYRYQKQRIIRVESEKAQKKELAHAKEIEKAYTELKATQSQLIQSEKMASLGELTAGIAHEIQNPLNFVNNFSEVSTELVDEMNEEIDKGKEQLTIGNMQLAISNMQIAKEIANDLKQNLEKINHHGKRAGDIVKGMLQHSRSNSGVKEPTNINALADEYLRLAYHGLRAKDKSFNATMKTDFDETIGNINIIPQDIGRVILNLITNAFYTVNEKLKAESGKLKADGESYEPTVSISTKKSGDKVLISVKDNGNGIPQKILDKIFQPFFTTKPTGQGTGLGLSLSYDIVKAHGGELRVETHEGEGSEFIIQLPHTK